MTTAQVVETSVTVNNNSPIQDYVHPDDETHPFDILLLSVYHNVRQSKFISWNIFFICYSTKFYSG